MTIAFSTLLLLLASVPLTIDMANDAVQPIVSATVAAILTIATVSASTAEMHSTIWWIRRFAFPTLLIFVWMIIQSIQIPIAAAVHPVWSAVAMALSEPTLSGHISADPNATSRGLFWYVTVVLLVISSALIARDRSRARAMLFALAAVTTLVSLELLASRLEILPVIFLIYRSDALTTVAFISAMTSSTLIAIAIENYLNSGNNSNDQWNLLLFRTLFGLFGIAVSIASLSLLMRMDQLLLTGFGFLILVSIPLSRKLAVPPWSATIITAALVLTAMLLALPFVEVPSHSANLSIEALTASMQALLNSPWLGNGVGTFDSIVQTYAVYGTSRPISAPSTAIMLAIEWGPALPVIMAGFVVQLFLFLFHGALCRGRDSYIPGCGAAVSLCILCLSFLDSGLLSAAVQVVLAVLAGLAIAQSAGRTTT